MLDDKGEFVDLDGPVVKQRAALGNYSTASVIRLHIAWHLSMDWDSRCANFSNFPMVAEIPLPISAALRAKSDRLGRPPPSAADFWASVRSDRFWELGFPVFCRRWAWASTDLNSEVRSCIDATAMVRGVVGDGGNATSAFLSPCNERNSIAWRLWTLSSKRRGRSRRFRACATDDELGGGRINHHSRIKRE